MLTFLQVFLTIVEALVCLLLIVAILIQRTRSQGMGLAFGAGMGEQMFGSQAGNVLTRATVVLSIIFLVNTTVLALIGTRRGGGSVVDKVPVAVQPQVPAPGPVPGGEMAPVPVPAPMDGGLPVAVPSTEVAVPSPAPEAAAAPVAEQPAAPAPAVEPPVAVQ